MPAFAHIGLGLASKRVTPDVPTWILLVSSMFIDFISFFCLDTLWITHSPIMALIWTFLAVIISFCSLKYINSKNLKINSETKQFNIKQISFTIGFLVFGHWFFDFIGWPMTVGDSNAIGTPLLFNDSVNYGLGVYTTLFGALFMEIASLSIGLYFYIQGKKQGKYNF